MQAFRSTTKFASQFRSTGLPRFYSTQKSYEHLLVSTPKPGVGLGMPLFVHSFF
jgi:enoyl-CoA hydratase